MGALVTLELEFLAIGYAHCMWFIVATVPETLEFGGEWPTGETPVPTMLAFLPLAETPTSTVRTPLWTLGLCDIVQCGLKHMWALVALELEFLAIGYAHCMWFIVPTVPETLEFGGEGPTGETPVPTMLAFLLSTETPTSTVWTPCWLFGVCGLVQCRLKHMRALVALELEFLATGYAHFIWFGIVPTVLETLEFGGEGPTSETPIPTMLAFLPPTEFLTSTVRTPCWLLGVCDLVQCRLKHVGTLVALELEFLVAAYAHCMWFIVPTVPETLEFGREWPISECVGFLLLHALWRSPLLEGGIFCLLLWR